MNHNLLWESYVLLKLRAGQELIDEYDVLNVNAIPDAIN